MHSVIYHGQLYSVAHNKIIRQEISVQPYLYLKLYLFTMFSFSHFYLWVRYQMKDIDNRNLKSLISLPKYKNRGRNYLK